MEAIAEKNLDVFQNSITSGSLLPPLGLKPEGNGRNAKKGIKTLKQGGAWHLEEKERKTVGRNALPLWKASHRILSFTQHLDSISYVPDPFTLPSVLEVELFINHIIQMVKLRLSSLLT